MNPFPASYGTRSLTRSSATSPTAILGDFSSAVGGVSIDMADFGEDADSLLLQAFSGPVARARCWPPPRATLPGGGVTASPARPCRSPRRASPRSGSSEADPGAPNSVFYDNITATVATTAVPEASTVVMSGLVALAGLGYGWRRKRAAA